MEGKEPALQDKVEKKRVPSRCIEFVEFLLLSVVGMIGSFLMNRRSLVSDSLTLILFGAGIFASLILIKIG